MIRKVNPKIILEDLCQVSLDWLENYSLKWFEENLPSHGKIWLPDETMRGLQSPFNKGEFREIILTGSFFLRLLESKFWMISNFRLWTFSSRMKFFLENYYKIPPDHIGILGRNSSDNTKTKLNFNEEVNLIYAGRFSLTKNITTLLKFVSLLQTEYQLKVTLDLFGEADDFNDFSIGRYSHSSLKEITTKITNELPWIIKPKFHGNVPQGEWTKVKFSNPVFISLSTSMYEDFGTAAQIAVDNGWPCILSDWGGHADCPGAYLIPVNFIAKTQDPIFVQNFKLKCMINYLLHSKNFSTGKSTSFIPDIFNKEKLDQSLDTFLSTMNPEILHVIRGNLSFFADTRKGSDFFKHYHFAYGPYNADHAFIINDLVENPDIELPINNTSEIIYLRELYGAYFFKRCHTFKKITLVKLQDIDLIKDFLRNKLNLNVVIDSIS